MSAFESLRRSVARALLPSRDRRLLDRAVRQLLPPGWPRAEPSQPGLMQGAEEMDLRRPLELLTRLEDPALQELFSALRRDAGINPGFGGHDAVDAGAIHNGYYPTPDAELYAGLIALHRPRRILEVGSGFSTAVARAAVTATGLDTEIHVIDPSPRRSVADVADVVEYERVEHSSLTRAEIAPDTLLFIDSSHVTRAGGDGPFVYGSLLPRLPAGVLVHVHDVFLPYEYPAVYVEWLYTEQYLLRALLANSRKFETVFPTYCVSRRHPEAMRRTFGPRVARDGDYEGASYWIRSVA